VAEQETDYRFTLANERTFLAWVRTALALLGASIVIGELSASSRPHGWDLTVLAVICTATAALISLTAFSRWRRVQDAIRRHEPLPAPTLTLRVTVVSIVFGAVACTAIVVR
jgi:putative membrane protein